MGIRLRSMAELIKSSDDEQIPAIVSTSCVINSDCLNELGITDNDQVIRDAAEVARRVGNKRLTHTLILVDEFQILIAISGRCSITCIDSPND